RTRIDRGLTSKLVHHLEQSHVLRESSTVYPNTSLYRTAGRLRYVEFTVDENGARNYQLVAVTEHSYLLDVLARARGGATIVQLATAIAAEAGVTAEEATAYIHELVDAQILVLDLELPITGPDTIETLADRLQCFAESREIGQIAQDVSSRMRELDQASIGNCASRYEDITQQLAKLPVPPGRTSAWQVDLFKPADRFALGPDVARMIEECVALLQRIAPVPGPDALTDFRDAFRTRYEERWVPLMEALDPETGIGFPVGAGSATDDLSLLAGFVANTAASESESAWNARDAFMVRKLAGLHAQNTREWRLDEADLQALDAKASAATLPDSCDLIVRLIASAQGSPDDDIKLQVHGCYSSSGRMLGRFCYGDAQLSERTRELLRKETEHRPDVIFAEVVHLPQGRAGNVIARPVLREHEIVFLGRSGAPDEQQIGVADLMIRWVGDRLVLYSIAHDKEVIPRQTSALNHAMTNGVSHFLSVLGRQNTRVSLGWNWGRLRYEPFLPRVSCARAILARAAWNLKAVDLQPILDARGAERLRAVQALRHARALPRFCLLMEGDTELLVDLDNVLSVDTFCDLVKNSPLVTLEECVPAVDDLAVYGPEGRFTHELVVPLLKNQVGPSPVAISGPLPRVAPQVTENLLPGSEWLFFKLYGGEGTADGVLTDAVAPVLAGLRERGVIDNWFFIRYRDPHTHLRLRLHGDPKRLNADALTTMHDVLSPMIESRRLWRIELATYERETHRYGGPANIERAERLFGFDSEAALTIVAACQGDQGATFRWQLALAGVDRWLRDFGLDLEARRRFARQARDGYSSEFNAQHKATQKWFAERFRAQRKAIEPLIAETHEPAEPALIAGLRALELRSLRVAPLISQMRELQERGLLSASLETIAHSVIHMFVNRVMRSSQRQQELVIYEFLARLYDSESARRRAPAQRSAHD
ncbi:MAG TPA: lantibiotic dehydratase, partial [Povalibacter sp.]